MIHCNSTDGIDESELNELIGKKLAGPGVASIGRSGTCKGDELCLHISCDLGHSPRTWLIIKGSIKPAENVSLAHIRDSCGTDHC